MQRTAQIIGAALVLLQLHGVAQAIQTCHKCEGINCQRTSYTATEQCADTLDTCVTVFQGQMVLAQGCLAQLSAEMRAKCNSQPVDHDDDAATAETEMESAAAHCQQCNAELCNNMSDNEFQCLQCDSSEDTNCASSPETLTPTGCPISRTTNSYCYAMIDGKRIVRGCATNLTQQTNCMNDENCLLCSPFEMSGCNRELKLDTTGDGGSGSGDGGSGSGSGDGGSGSGSGDGGSGSGSGSGDGGSGSGSGDGGSGSGSGDGGSGSGSGSGDGGSGSGDGGSGSGSGSGDGGSGSGSGSGSGDGGSGSGSGDGSSGSGSGSGDGGSGSGSGSGSGDGGSGSGSGSGSGDGGSGSGSDSGSGDGGSGSGSGDGDGGSGSGSGSGDGGSGSDGGHNDVARKIGSKLLTITLYLIPVIMYFKF